MPYSQINDYPADIRSRAANIRLACFDVDGTLTDGRLILDDTGGESKAFHIHDGQGLALLRKVGIAVAFVTARPGTIAERRAAELGAQAHVGIKDKLGCVRDIAARQGIAMDAVAFMGDDLVDLPVLRACGLAAAPANAHPWISDAVHWRSTARGGEGAARELCDLLLVAQGHAQKLLAGDSDRQRPE